MGDKKLDKKDNKGEGSEDLNFFMSGAAERGQSVSMV
jgi:hypothetical protein